LQWRGKPGEIGDSFKWGTGTDSSISGRMKRWQYSKVSVGAGGTVTDEDLNSMYVQDNDAKPQRISNNESRTSNDKEPVSFYFGETGKGILKYGAEYWLYFILIPSLVLSFILDRWIFKADQMVLSFAMGVLGIYFIVLSVGIWLDREIAEFYYFKPGGRDRTSPANWWGSDFSWGIKVMRWVYAPLFLLLGFGGIFIAGLCLHHYFDPHWIPAPTVSHHRFF